MPKIGLLLCLLMASISYAELPYIPDDNKAQWNDEYLDGKVDSVKADVNALSGGSSVGVVDIAHGGTAGTTAAQARTNLGVPSNTGTGASGTWPINITGSAATATDSSKVAKTGDTMTGQLTMSGSSIAFVNGGSIENVGSIKFASVDVTNFVPYSGATQNVTLGSYNLTAGNYYGNGSTLSNIITSTSAILAEIDTVKVSTGAETAARIAADAAIGVTTATIYAALTSTGSALTAETAARIAADLAIGVSTGTIYSALNSTAAALTAETSARVARDLELIPSSATGTYGIRVASANYAPGDNLGNHTATQNLDLNKSNAINIDMAGIGLYRTDWGVEEESVRNAPTFELDVYGNSAIQKGSQLFATDIVAISSTSATLPNTVSVSIDCVTSGCGNSDPSGLISDNGTYFRFYGGNGDSIIIETAYWNNDVPAGTTVIGAKGFIEKYSNAPSNIVTGIFEGTDSSYCKLNKLSSGGPQGFDQCRVNDWAVTASTYVYGNDSYSWGYQITNEDANGTSFGWAQAIKLTGPATAYIDVMKMQLFYIDNDAFKVGYNTDRMTIDYGGSPVVYVSTFNSMGVMVEPLTISGSINASGGFFKNGVEISGGAGGDNLGSHVSTKTITANYGISGSTAVFSGPVSASSVVVTSGFYGDGANITGITGNHIVNFRASTDTLAGDVTGTYGATVVGDNSHLHAMSSLQGVLSSTTQVSMTLINLSTVTTALATKVPYTGATASVSLGSYGLTASSFTTSGNVTAYAVNASSVVSTPQLCLNGTCMTEITASVGSGMWRLFASSTLTAASTTTINGLQAGRHYRIFYSLKQNTTAGELRMLINSKTTGYYWATFGHNSGAASGTIGANGASGAWPLAYNGATTPAGYNTSGDWNLFIDTVSLVPHLQGKGARWNGSNIEQALTYGDWAGSIGASTFPISIYTSAGTLTGTIYIQEFVP